MEKTYLQWNIVNWVTVLVMASVGIAVFGAAMSVVRSRLGTGTAAEGEA